MLKKASDDGAHTDAAGESFNAGAKDAETADDEIDVYAGVGSIVQGFDDARLEKRVHLGDDVRRAAGAGVFHLAADEAEEAFRHGERSDKERTVVIDLGMRGQVVEDHVHALGNLRIAGEKAQVGVEARSDGVVVSGAKMAVAAGY